MIATNRRTTKENDVIRVHCRTNLDVAHERWPTELPAVPRVGDEIMSATVHSTHTNKVFQLSLQVVHVAWEPEAHPRLRNGLSNAEWILRIELHMTNFQKMLPCAGNPEGRGSIRAFFEWYGPLVGRSVSAFI